MPGPEEPGKTSEHQRKWPAHLLSGSGATKVEVSVRSRGAREAAERQPRGQSSLRPEVRFWKRSQRPGMSGSERPRRPPDVTNGDEAAVRVSQPELFQGSQAC